MKENFTKDFDKLLKDAAENAFTGNTPDVWAEVNNALHPQKDRRRYIIPFFSLLTIILGGIGIWWGYSAAISRKKTNNSIAQNTQQKLTTNEVDKTIASNENVINHNFNSKGEKDANASAPSNMIFDYNKLNSLTNNSKQLFHENHTHKNDAQNNKANAVINNRVLAKKSLTLTRMHYVNNKTIAPYKENMRSITPNNMDNVNNDKFTCQLKQRQFLLPLEVSSMFASVGKANISSTKPLPAIITVNSSLLDNNSIKPVKKPFSVKVELHVIAHVGIIETNNTQNILVSELLKARRYETQNQGNVDYGVNSFGANTIIEKGKLPKSTNQISLGSGVQIKKGISRRIKLVASIDAVYNSWKQDAFNSSISYAPINNNASFYNDVLISSGYSNTLRSPFSNDVVTLKSSTVNAGISLGYEFLLIGSKSKKKAAGNGLWLQSLFGAQYIIRDNVFYYNNQTQDYIKDKDLSIKTQLNTKFGLLYNFGKRGQYNIGVIAHGNIFNTAKNINYIKPINIYGTQLQIGYRIK